MLRFDCTARDGEARTGVVRARAGPIQTPAFMPVGTRASVRGLSADALAATGAQVVLANTYHLMLQPGADVVAAHGGLHRFMNWSGNILTDSGGYQVFSLRARIEPDGARFRSPIDGSEVFLSPERCIQLQHDLDADIIMQLDDCTAYPAEPGDAARSMRLSLDWAARCLNAHGDHTSALFGIVQGSHYPELRAESAAGLRALGFAGYAIGGLAVGEPPEQMRRTLRATAPLLPEDQPRYLMGVGRPQDLVEAVHLGMDLFDCVLPTRAGRHGRLYTRRGEINLRNARWRTETAPPDPDCRCPCCAHHSCAYLHHLHRSGEMLGAQLASLHNLHYYAGLMRQMRTAIASGTLGAFRDEFYNLRCENPPES